MFAIFKKPCSLLDARQRPEVLVLAPRFPAINQPWIDTYLEQLLRNQLAFRVLSWNANPGVYSAKVDELRLRDYAVVAPTGGTRRVRAILNALIRFPVLSASLFAKVLRQGKSGTDLRRRVRRGLVGICNYSIIKLFPAVQVIHSHSEFMSAAFLEAAEFAGIPLVVTFHGLPPKGVQPISSERRVMVGQYAAAILVNTRFARDQAVHLGYPVEKIKIIPQGLPLTDFPDGRRIEESAANTVRVLSVGRFHRDKGQAYSMLALARLLRDGLDVCWDFVGVGPDQTRLESLARGLGISPRVRFHNGVSFDELKNLYRSSHLFVLASVPSSDPNEHVETQGVVLQEAQAMGCIPIATRVGGIPECINHGIDGFLVKPRSHREIADAISAAVRQRAAWPELRRRARENVERCFSADVVGDQVTKVLRSVAAGSYDSL